MNIRHIVLAIVMFAVGFVISTVIGSRSLASLSNPLPSAKRTESAAAAQVTQTPSTSQRWEYRVLTKHSYTRINDKDLNTELIRLGEQGFEISWSAQSGSDGAFHLTLLLRRPRQ
jgi:hypothetical protein